LSLPTPLKTQPHAEPDQPIHTRQAAEPWPSLPALDENLYVVHYSSGLIRDAASGTPSVSAIVVQQILRRQPSVFAAIRFAEAAGITPAALPGDLPGLEKTLLEAFLEFVAAHPKATWLHWRMNQAQFGFGVLAQRARLHGLDWVEIPPERCFDLPSYLKRRYGDDYAPHPRLFGAFRLNGLNAPDLLDEEAAAEAWGRRDHVGLLVSLARKVDGIAILFDRARLGTFRAGAPPVDSPAPPEGPAEGDIIMTPGGERIWLRGRPVRLTDTLRRVLSHVLRDQGQYVGALVRSLGFGSCSHFHRHLPDLRRRLEAELDGSGWQLRIQCSEGRVCWEWLQAKHWPAAVTA
jgi:hypothetical protein